MSRSRRHHPVAGFTTARSEKEDKRLANRTLRARVRTQFASHGDERPLPTLREVSDSWCMPKDGKMRFDPLRYPKSMRK
jgi:hypothetical protein